MVQALARKIVVEIELPEGIELDEVLRGVKYRVLDSGGTGRKPGTAGPRNLRQAVMELRKKYKERLGGESSLEEFYRLEAEDP